MLRNFRSISPRTLGGQVIALLGVVLLSTLTIFSLSVFYFVNRTESEAWRSRQSEAARNAAGTVSGFIQRVADALFVVSIVEPDQLVGDSDELNALIQKNPAFLEIVRMDSSGHIFASASRDKNVLSNLITIPQSQWFLQARQGQTFIGDVQLSANNEPYLIMAVPSADKGVVAARVQMDVLWEVVQNIHFGESGRAYVVSRNGRVVAHTDPEIVLRNATIQEQPEFAAMSSAPNNEWSGTYTNFENTSVVGYTSHIPGTDWLIITELPLGEVFSATKNTIYLLGAEALLLMLAVSLMTVQYVQLRIVKPMEQLRDGADRIGRGDLQHRIDLPRKDEIGQLASAFNTMAADLEKQQGNLQKAIAYEYESRRAQELDILLKASEATSSSLDFDTVMHTLASQLLEISGFESCFISEWDKETDTVIGRLDDSRTFWREENRDSYSMNDYPRSNQVLLTGNPIILQGDFEAEEKQWMDGLKRTAVIILALYSQEKIIGLVELETIKKNKIFDQRVLRECQKILANAAISIEEPLSANEPRKLFEIEDVLLQATGAEVCSFSEWDKPENRLYNLAVSTKITWATGQGTRFNPDLETWRMALDQGKTINFVRSEDNTTKAIVFDGTETMEVQSLLIFPLRKGDERIGVIELYDFNHKIQVTPEQITLLRTIADKASYSIENARLLGQTQKRLAEQTELLKEKEVLLKEIHHRVKNNLQIISSLLKLQADRVTDTQTLQILADSQVRVRSMALIHEKLYQSQSLAKIDIGEYVKSLAADLFRSYRHNFSVIHLKVQADEVELDLDRAVTCGLILNELMTNALKYAFPDGRNGTLWVELRANPGRILSLRVADDGVGIPANSEIRNAKSLGLQLVNSLVRQLDGKLELEHSKGTDFRVSFEY